MTNSVVKWHCERLMNCIRLVGVFSFSPLTRARSSITNDVVIIHLSVLVGAVDRGGGGERIGLLMECKNLSEIVSVRLKLFVKSSNKLLRGIILAM